MIERRVVLPPPRHAMSAPVSYQLALWLGALAVPRLPREARPSRDGEVVMGDNRKTMPVPNGSR